MAESPLAFAYLIEAIATAMSDAEIARLETLARVHYGGARRATLDTEIAARRMNLELARLAAAESQAH